MLEKLNEKFGIENRLHFAEGNGGLPKAVLHHPQGSMAEIYLYGAHITSFIPSSFDDVLYLSPRAEFAHGRAIRGGIPLVFPQFGPGKLPSHGFARNKPWELCETSWQDNAVSISFILQADEQSYALWPHHFFAQLEVNLSDLLRTTIRVTHHGQEPLNFQFAFHTYFKVADLTQTLIQGLGNLTYLDNTKNRSKGTEDRNEMSIREEVDRIYLHTPHSLSIVDSAAKRRILVEKSALDDSVLWNPWIEKGKSLIDLEVDGYKKFVCLESGIIHLPATLAPGNSFVASQSIRCEAITS